MYLYLLTVGQPSQVVGVTVTTTVQNNAPALIVSWNAVDGRLDYYSLCNGTNRAGPSENNCQQLFTRITTTTLTSLNRGTVYYVWVAAFFESLGPYSERAQATTYDCKFSNVQMQEFSKYYCI